MYQLNFSNGSIKRTRKITKVTVLQFGSITAEQSITALTECMKEHLIQQVTISHQVCYHNLQTLTHEIFKIKNNVTPEILREFSSQGKQLYSQKYYNPAGQKYFMKQMSKLWETLQTKLKNILSPTALKKKIPNGTQRTVRIIYIKGTYKTFL